MTIDCSQLDDLLFDASPLAMETAARHGETCAACAARLAEWNDLTATAQSLHTTWTNDLLWPRIERALREERRRSPMKRLWQIAAALVLLAGVGGTILFALRAQTHDAAFDRDILRITALDEVERAEQTHVVAIRKLERLADAKLEEDTPLMVSYKEKLMLLDDAIAECQTNIDRNRQNAHLRTQLLAMYSEKQRTLEDVLQEDTHDSNH